MAAEAQLRLLEAPQRGGTAPGPAPPPPPRPQPSIRPSGAGERYSVPALAEQYLQHLAVARRCSPRTVQAYGSDYRKLAALLSEAGHSGDVRHLRAGDLQACLLGLQHLAPASVARTLYAWRSLLGYLCRQGLLSSNPAAAVDSPAREQRLPPQLTPEQVQRLQAVAVADQDQVVVGLLAYAGLRRGELLGINVEDLAADLSSLRVRGKGRRERAVPVHAGLREPLERHLDQLAPAGGALLRNQAGQRMSPTTLHRRLRRLGRQAGLAHLHPHLLRHYFATALLRAGADIATVAELMGHSNLSTTAIYLHSDSRTKREAISRLPVAMGSPRAGDAARLGQRSPP